jgi:hypothetical protein
MNCTAVICPIGHDSRPLLQPQPQDRDAHGKRERDKIAAVTTTAAPDLGLHDAIVLCDSAAEEARRCDRDDVATRIAQQAEQLRNPLWHVLLIGEFKQGKSALVNALLDMRVCPTDAELATAIPILVKYATSPEAALVMREPGTDDTPGTTATVPFAVAQREAVDLGGRVAASTPSAVEIGVPHPLLARGVVLVDTPGVGGGLAAAHAAATLRALSLAHAVVFVSDASQPFTAPELAFLQQAAEMCPTIVCALTKIDFYPSWRIVLDDDRRHLDAAGLDIKIFPVAPPLLHTGRRANDNELIAESGIDRLAGWIENVVADDRERVAVRTAASIVRSALTPIVEALRDEQQALADPDGSGDLLTQLQSAEEQTQRLKTSLVRAQQLLTDRFVELGDHVEIDLGDRFREIRRLGTDRIGTADPARSWADFEAWLYETTNASMTEHYQQLRAGAGDIVVDVTEQLKALASELDVPAVDVIPTELDVALAMPEFSKSSGFQLGVLAVRGSASSMAICGMIGTFFTFAIPVLTPTAALLSATLARRALKDAKESQVAQRRQDASRALQAYIEEVMPIVRRESHDAVRRIRRTVNEWFGERADETSRNSQQALEATARAIRSDQDSRVRRQDEIAAQLPRIERVLKVAEGLLSITATPTAPSSPASAGSL